MRGPIGYDLVSLLKDCYISWSRERVERWVRGYRRVLGNLGANVGDSEYQFMRWFDLIGVQRHIKVLGIFARLWHRDGKIGYLADLPLTLDYVRDACRRYPELVEFERWLEWRVVPQLAAGECAPERQAGARQAEAEAARPRPKAKPKRQIQTQEEKGRREEESRARDAPVEARRQAHGETPGEAPGEAPAKRLVKRVLKRVKRGGRKLAARRRRSRRSHT